MPSVLLLSPVRPCSSVKQSEGTQMRFAALPATIGRAILGCDWLDLAMEDRPVVHLEGVEGEDHPQAILLDLALVALLV